MNARTGVGLDLHRWDDSRPLRLAGVEFPGEPGLAGHSDGDAVCHAVADALLGAAALGDVGEHFPDSDPAFAGIAGLELLAETVEILARAGFVPLHCDVTVIAMRPAIAPRREEMRRSLASVLRVGSNDVSVKATRPEGLGLTGDGVGCLAAATVGPAPDR